MARAPSPALLRNGERLSDFLGGQSCHTDDFSATGLAGRYGNGGTRNLQKICQEFYTGLVGTVVRRRGGERQLERVAEFASDSIFLGVRVNFNGEVTPVEVSCVGIISRRT
jgi:hypothetical protein